MRRPDPRRHRISAAVGFLVIIFLLLCDSYLRNHTWFGIPLAIYSVAGLLVTALALHAHRIRGQHRPGSCPACGYDLIGNTTGLCPECGYTIVQTPGAENVQRLSERAREAVALAHREARKRNHDYIGTEHLLLGLLALEDTGSAAPWRKRGLDPARVEAELRKLRTDGCKPSTGVRPPWTPAARRAIAYAAHTSGTNLAAPAGPDDLLHGLLRENESAAAIILRRIGFPPAFMHPPSTSNASPPNPTPPPAPP